MRKRYHQGAHVSAGGDSLSLTAKAQATGMPIQAEHDGKNCCPNYFSDSHSRLGWLLLFDMVERKQRANMNLQERGGSKT